MARQYLTMKVALVGKVTEVVMGGTKHSGRNSYSSRGSYSSR